MSEGSGEANNLVQKAGKLSKKADNKAAGAAKSISQKTSEIIKKIIKWISSLGCASSLFLLVVLLVISLIVMLITLLIGASNGGFGENSYTVGSGSYGEGDLTQKGTFYPRLKEPIKGEESVNHTGNKVEHYYYNSTNPFEASGRYGMPNCTAYVWSRVYEMLDTTPNLCTGDAQNWYDFNKNYDYYPYGDSPRLGAIAVWSHDNAGHVAVVEKIEGTKVTFSNSAWHGKNFFLREVDSTDQTNYWTDSSWNLLGFIYVYDEITYNDSTDDMLTPNGNFYPRFDTPEKGQKSVNHSGNNVEFYYFNNKNPYDAIGTPMPDCTCYAWSRAYEMLGTEPNLTPRDNPLDAQYWFDYNKKNNNYPYGKTPRLGAIAVWSHDNAGHVAVVEKIEGTTVTFSNSAYKRNDLFFYTNEIDYKAYPNYAYKSSWKFLGFIYVMDKTKYENDSTYIPKNEDEFVQMFNQYFKKKGYSKAAICGILGNIYAECGMQSYWYFAEYVEDAGGAEGNSGGICMWYAENCDRFRRDCPNWNKSLTAQFEYLAGTLDVDGQGPSNTTKYYYWCTGCKAAIQGVSNTKEGAKQAAKEFMNLYERPNMSFDQSIRWKKAAEYWDMLG